MAMLSLIRRRFPHRLMPNLALFLPWVYGLYTRFCCMDVLTVTPKIPNIWKLVCLRDIPRRSLRSLLYLNTDLGKNGPRMFWKWLDRQKWRKMLPSPHQQLGLWNRTQIFLWVTSRTMATPSVFDIALASWVEFHREVRVSVVMVDKSLQEQYFISETPMFLPAEVFLGLLEFKHPCAKSIASDTQVRFDILLWLWTIQATISGRTWCSLARVLAIMSIMGYACENQSGLCPLHAFDSHIKAIMEFWNRNRDEDFFRCHPVLSNPEICLHYTALCVVL